MTVSAQAFRQPDFVEQVLAALRDAAANPRLLKLELTESLLLHDVEGSILKMQALRTLGVGFSLDDFGTGYSSLSYLKRLPLDQLKIDQSFVRDVLTDPNDATIACTIITLARSLGLDVVAGGGGDRRAARVLAAQRLPPVPGLPVRAYWTCGAAVVCYQICSYWRILHKRYRLILFK